jgi:hypothetical protein
MSLGCTERKQSHGVDTLSFFGEMNLMRDRLYPFLLVHFVQEDLRSVNQIAPSGTIIYHWST